MAAGDTTVGIGPYYGARDDTRLYAVADKLCAQFGEPAAAH